MTVALRPLKTSAENTSIHSGQTTNIPGHEYTETTAIDEIREPVCTVFFDSYLQLTRPILTTNPTAR